MSDLVRLQPFRLDIDDVARIHLTNARPRILTFVLPFLAFSFVVLVTYLNVPWYVALLVLLVASVLGFMGQPKRMKQLLSKPAYSAGFVERHVEATPAAFRQYDGQGTDTTIPWEKFIAAKIMRDHYVLTLIPGQNVLVPRKAFTSMADEQIFQQYVRTKVPKVTGF